MAGARRGGYGGGLKPVRTAAARRPLQARTVYCVVLMIFIDSIIGNLTIIQ